MMGWVQPWEWFFGGKTCRLTDETRMLFSCVVAGCCCCCSRYQCGEVWESTSLCRKGMASQKARPRDQER